MPSDAMPNASYDLAAFDAFSLEDAKRRTLGDLMHDEELIGEKDERWTSETAYTAELIAETLSPKGGQLILDYGCGAGRVSKVLINQLSCRVIGADQSPAMMLISERYVASSQFQAVYHENVGGLAGGCDAAVCIFVLQHSICPDADVQRISDALKPGGKLLVINEGGRFVPTVERGFVSDGVDIRDCLFRVFGEPVSSGKLDPTRVDPRFSDRTFWHVYQKE